MTKSNTNYTIRTDEHRKMFKVWYKRNYDPVPLNAKTGGKKLLGCFVDDGKLVKIPLDRAYNNKYIDLFWNYMRLVEDYKGKIPRWGKENKSKKGKSRLPSEDYNKYIKSIEWLQKSRILIKSRGSICEVCCSGRILHSHHYNYHFLGIERDQDLFCLCKRCHDWYHMIIPSHSLPQDRDLPIGNRLLHIVQTVQKAKKLYP